MTVGEIAAILRSKNAGIGLITVDVACADAAGYEAVRAALTRDRVAAAYGITAGQVLDIVYFDAGMALKLTFLRPEVAGGAGLGETDLYGSAQYAPLLELKV